MVIFYSPASWFRRSGLLLFCLHLLLFIVCLEPFHAGTWFQTEPAMATMFALGTLNAAWLAIGIYKSWLAFERPVHPLLYGLMAWAVWQFICLPASSNILRSWFGPPHLGEGSGWQIMLMLCVVLAMPLWRLQSYKKIILAVATLSLCAMTWLHFNPKVLCNPKLDNYGIDNPAAPGNWPDYLPFIAGWLWIAYASATSIRTPARHGWMVILFCIVLLVGQNSSARAMMFPILIGSSLILRLQLMRHKPRWIANIISVNKKWKILAAIGLFLPLLWIMISQDGNLFSCKNASLAERAIYNHVAVAAITDTPSRLLTGNGWGNFADDMFKFGLVDGLASFRGGQFSPNSLWLHNFVFHPHSQPMQSLLATGLIGFLIFISLPLLAIWPLRKSLFWWCAPVFIVLNAMANLWFLLPQVMAFQALGLAALCAGRPARIRDTRNIPRWFTLVCGALVLLLAASSAQQVKMIAYGERLKNIMSEDPNQPGIIEWVEQDMECGGERMAEAILYFSQNIAGKAAAGQAAENDRDWLRNFFTIANHAALKPDSYAGIAKLEAELSILLFQLPRDSILDSLKPQVKENFVSAILRISAKYPQREDYIAPFLMNIEGFTGGDQNQQREILENILKVAPNHRSALWLLGIMENNDDMKKQAVKLGVERVYPVTDTELENYK